MKNAYVKRLAIFTPKGKPFYLLLFPAIKKAFNELNVEVYGGTEWLSENELLNFVKLFKPDAILEINRTRKQVPFLPKTVKHISWMIDTAEMPYEMIADSEIIYFIGANWFINYSRYSKNIQGKVDFLPPGSGQQDYFYQERSYLSDFSFVGHISSPWSQSELARRIVCKDDNKSVTFGDLYAALCKKLNDWIKNYDNQKYLEFALDIVSDMTGSEACVMDSKLRYDICGRSIRYIFRQKLINLIIASFKTPSLRIFGSENWLYYKDYKKYYQKSLDNHFDLRWVYQTSKINLHEGVGLHFRTFDCMASGGLLFYKQNPDDDCYGGMNYYFEPGKHYISFNEENVIEKANQYIKDYKSGRRIGRRASQLVHEKHTWKDRAKKILTDINEI